MLKNARLYSRSPLSLSALFLVGITALSCGKSGNNTESKQERIKYILQAKPVTDPRYVKALSGLEKKITFGKPDQTNAELEEGLSKEVFTDAEKKEPQTVTYSFKPENGDTQTGTLTAEAIRGSKLSYIETTEILDGRDVKSSIDFYDDLKKVSSSVRTEIEYAVLPNGYPYTKEVRRFGTTGKLISKVTRHFNATTKIHTVKRIGDIESYEEPESEPSLTYKRVLLVVGDDPAAVVESSQTFVYDAAGKETLTQEVKDVFDPVTKEWTGYHSKWTDDDSRWEENCVLAQGGTINCDGTRKDFRGILKSTTKTQLKIRLEVFPSEGANPRQTYAYDTISSETVFNDAAATSGRESQIGEKSSFVYDSNFQVISELYTNTMRTQPTNVTRDVPTLKKVWTRMPDGRQLTYTKYKNDSATPSYHTVREYK